MVVYLVSLNSKFDSKMSNVLFTFEARICQKRFCEVPLAKFGGFYSAVTIEDCKQAHSVAVNVFVADVCVFHGQSPALHA